MTTKFVVEKASARMTTQPRTIRMDDCAEVETRIYDALLRKPAALDRAYYNELPLEPFTVVLATNDSAVTALNL